MTDFKKTRVELINNTTKPIYKQIGLWNEKKPCTKAEAINIYLNGGGYTEVKEYANYIVVGSYSAGDMF